MSEAKFSKEELEKIKANIRKEVKAELKREEAQQKSGKNTGVKKELLTGNYGKPGKGYFRVVKKIYKGKGKDRKPLYYASDFKDTDNILHGDLDKDGKPIRQSKSLKEVYTAKAKDKLNMVEKVIEP